MQGYEVKIETASRELSAKERIMVKDTSSAIKLDEATADGVKVKFKPVAYVILNVHNEKSDHKDYLNYLMIAEDGTKYVTGSESLWTSFIDIWEEMEDVEEDEPWEITAYRMPSKNYKGKDFLTCSIC